mmetsp:Transcript_63106/g.137139  ORF Transcript_63106/g.137139 Transcript_63106/m.137139 type:complete len:200 (-) Transcript_63106:481-1080(-)
MKVCQGRQLVNNDLVDVTPKSQQVLSSKRGQLVPRPALAVHDKVVDAKPHLCVQLWQSAFVVGLDGLPFVVLKFLDAAVDAVLPHPGRLLHKWNKQLKHVMRLQKPRGDSERHRDAVVSQEAQNGDYAHADLELAFSELLFQVAQVVPLGNFLRRGDLVHKLLVGSAEEVSEFPNTVVHQVDQSITSFLAACAMKEADF